MLPWQPPFPPQLLGFGSQLTRFCGDSSSVVFVASATWDSIFSVDENAQHEPHMPWFLILVTTPLSLQSTDFGRSDRRKSLGMSRVANARGARPAAVCSARGLTQP